MAPSILFLLISLLFIQSSGDLQQHNEEGHISVMISDKGLDFAKDLLIDKAIASIVMSQLPEIEKSVQVPLVGKAKVVLSEITIKDIQINSSTVETGDSGIVVVVSGATANLNMNWRYSCSSWLVPIGISDSGTATVKVKDLEVGLTVNLRNQGGTLKLILLDYGCNVGDISIKLNGGAAWLYQVLVDAFEGNIASSVEDAISKKIREGISTLDNLLKSLPHTISIDQTAVLNVSFVDNPVLSNSSIEVEINGLFIGTNKVLVPRSSLNGLETSTSCGGSPKMIKISIHEDVFNSASSVYFTADSMQWILDELPDQNLLNTAEWRFIVPQLFKQYPNDDMNLNISVSSAPVIQVTNQDIKATINLDIIIDVLESGQVIPVACISVDISASFAAEIIGNNVTGKLKLIKFSTNLKWSKIGKLHMQLIQSLTSSVLKTVIIPYLNSQLKRGIELPILDGFAVCNARIAYAQPWIEVCSDVSFSGDSYLMLLPASVS
ncbi:putative BPI/LBP family protein At1g04970 [Arachis duranensis]|uniref:BPI/LBP family protein At1g04970 n=1 Tax=Arachis duranensis TaxID=130453 RepID=A0A6P4DVU0_ARADU|nr:putative BPI/LBP family protein At1g04970 [Arachis duranensis]